MKSSSSARPPAVLAFVALALAACAPAAAPATAPAAAPTVAAAAEPAPTGTLCSAAATGRLTAELAAESQWWLLDLQTDCVPGAGVERAYRELLRGREPARTIVVAVIDSGIDVEHEDLVENVWRNPAERSGTGSDDDGNGYVDDLNGWNFIGGPDGTNVHHDTYELTRLYAALRARFEGARADTLSAAARDELEHYRALRAELEAKRAEATQLLEQTRAIALAIPRFTALLRDYLDADTLSTDQIAGIRSTRGDVRQAQRVLLQMAALGITFEMIERDQQHLENRLAYGFNPDFDPRPIVGDDYSDLEERHYGNADVRGPHADHGTHVAGIIAAQRGNALGSDGIATSVRIMSVRAVPDGDERDKDVANAIRYAVDNGAQIINMSFGKEHSPQKHAVDAAVRYADSRGVLMIHAAGNDGADLDASPSFPSRYYLDGGEAANWIEVGASAWWAADSIAAPFTNYGHEHVHVLAPGVDILAPVTGGRYERNSGTSMAAPVVSGLAALLMAYYPDLAAADVKRIILDSATRLDGQRVLRPGDRESRIGFDQLSATGGIVNAYAALQLAEQLSTAARRE